MELVRKLQEEPGGFAVWGAGNSGRCTRRFLEEHSDGRLKPRYIVDSNPSLWGRDNIISPEKFFSLKDSPTYLVVAVYVADQVLEQIQASGYDGKVCCVNAAALYGQGDIWELYEEHFPQLEETFRLLADEGSQSAFAGFLNYIRTLDDRYLARINGNSWDKTVDPSILHPTGQEHFVDVGAFTGDTIAAFLKHSGGKYQSILAFEPDGENFAMLRQYVRENKLERVILKQMAAGEENGTLYFETGISESCHIAQSGSRAIEVCRLDTLPEAKDTTILKISANGSELSVLKGAENLLQHNTPKIAAYASGTLLWEIPAFLKHVNPDYKIYYRHYGLGRQAMICYAIL